MSQPRSISLIGSTGSIGQSTCDVVRRLPERLRLVGLAAHSSWELLLQQTLEFRPTHVGLVSREAASSLRANLPPDLRCEVLDGPTALEEIACLPQASTVVCAALGAAGIPPVVSAIRAGKNVGLANKEVLVAAGEPVTALARLHGVSVLPIDSEHSAIFQCLRGERSEEVRGLMLTASGGPFRQFPLAQLREVTPAQALQHPNWSMGEKITVDSASLMNKGLEVIEARWLFGIAYDRIRVMVHPQSIIHSMVEFHDGSVMAQLGIADMRIPIQFACSFPERWPADHLPRLDLAAVGSLTFEEPDLERFRCLALAFRCGRLGGTFPAALNAANEVAVSAFLADRLPFLGIPRVLETVLERHDGQPRATLENVLAADAWARVEAERIVAEVR